MSTLEQQRAQMALGHINAVKAKPGESDKDEKKYASIVYGMTTLLRTAGLCQSLAFIQSRKPEPQKLFLAHLADQLKRVDNSITKENVIEKVVSSEIDQYARLTQEAIACVDWYKRFVQGVLKIDQAEADQGTT